MCVKMEKLMEKLREEGKNETEKIKTRQENLKEEKTKSYESE